MKKKKPAFFPSPPAFFLLWCQSMKQTTRQAKISLKPISYLFKEVWILQWGARPRWNRHLRVFIKLPISLLTFVTTTDQEKKKKEGSFFRLSLSLFHSENGLSVRAPVRWQGQTCTFLWHVLINSWETLRLWVRRPRPPKSAHWKTLEN